MEAVLAAKIVVAIAVCWPREYLIENPAELAHFDLGFHAKMQSVLGFDRVRVHSRQVSSEQKMRLQRLLGYFYLSALRCEFCQCNRHRYLHPYCLCLTVGAYVHVQQLPVLLLSLLMFAVLRVRLRGYLAQQQQVQHHRGHHYAAYSLLLPRVGEDKTFLRLEVAHWIFRSRAQTVECAQTGGVPVV